MSKNEVPLGQKRIAIWLVNNTIKVCRTYKEQNEKTLLRVTYQVFFCIKHILIIPAVGFQHTTLSGICPYEPSPLIVFYLHVYGSLKRYPSS